MEEFQTYPGWFLLFKPKFPRVVSLHCLVNGLHSPENHQINKHVLLEWSITQDLSNGWLIVLNNSVCVVFLLN